MSTLQGLGITVDLPGGWEGRIAARVPEAYDPAYASAAGGERRATSGALVHAANFALPTATGDFGSGAVEVMGSRDLLVILFEYDRASAGQAMFAARGIPRLGVRDFSPSRLQRTLPGQGGAQRFFNTAGRALCLYVVLGSYGRRLGTIPIVNDVLGRITIT